MNENFHERRYSQRFPIHQYVLINLGNGGQEIAAFSENISSGGAFVYCELRGSAESLTNDATITEQPDWERFVQTLNLSDYPHSS